MTNQQAEQKGTVMLNDPGHPIWKIIRLAVVGVILLAFLALNYERLDSRDATTILGVLLGLAGFDAAKAQVTKHGSDDIKGQS